MQSPPVCGADSMRFTRDLLLAIIALPGVLCFGDDEMPAPRPWDTCFWVEGKGGSCTTDNPALPFRQFLQPKLMAGEKTSGIASELTFDIGEHLQMSPEWREVGKFGGNRVRQIDYVLADAGVQNGVVTCASFVVIERSPGIFAPLLKWSGEMGEAVLFRVSGGSVLVVRKDTGGRWHEILTWAWVWTAAGPIRLEVERAVLNAVEKVYPAGDYVPSGMSEWPSLHTHTFLVGPDDTVDAWFELNGNKLLVKRVERKSIYIENAPVKRWP
jgi:hypothetical protein